MCNAAVNQAVGALNVNMEKEKDEAGKSSSSTDEALDPRLASLLKNLLKSISDSNCTYSHACIVGVFVWGPPQWRQCATRRVRCRWRPCRLRHCRSHRRSHHPSRRRMQEGGRARPIQARNAQKRALFAPPPTPLFTCRGRNPHVKGIKNPAAGVENAVLFSGSRRRQPREGGEEGAEEGRRRKGRRAQSLAAPRRV